MSPTLSRTTPLTTRRLDCCAAGTTSAALGEEEEATGVTELESGNARESVKIDRVDAESVVSDESESEFESDVDSSGPAGVAAASSGEGTLDDSRVGDCRLGDGEGNRGDAALEEARGVLSEDSEDR